VSAFVSIPRQGSWHTGTHAATKVLPPSAPRETHAQRETYLESEVRRISPLTISTCIVTIECAVVWQVKVETEREGEKDTNESNPQYVYSVA